MLAKDLDIIAQQAADPDIAKLCQLIQDNYKYPVDSVLISSKLDLLGHVNVNQFEILVPEGYRRFLTKGLAAAGRRPSVSAEVQDESPKDSEMPPEVNLAAADAVPKPPAGLVLTRERPEDSLLEIARHEGQGKPGFVMYSIDVSDFAKGGTIEIKIRVGGGDASVQFELCGPVPDSPGFFLTFQDIPKIAPGETKTITHKFEKGEKLSLVVKAHSPPDSPAQASAFLATVTVK